MPASSLRGSFRLMPPAPRSGELPNKLYSSRRETTQGARIASHHPDASRRDRWPERDQLETGELTEAEAIRRAQQGDADAFERIYRLHSRRVYALCLRMVGNTAEAEDSPRKPSCSSFARSPRSGASRRFPRGCIACRSTLS